MDIRGPRLRKPSDRALEFTSSMASDGTIARHVIAVNMAHMVALARAKEVDARTAGKCLHFLISASPTIDPASKAEDFHQQLEQDAVDALGVETAGYLNYGKSRNDQVATAMRMELRLRVLILMAAIAELRGVLLLRANKDGAAIFPAYTHLQRAQPVTLAHHLLAHFDAFGRDSQRLVQLFHRVNLSPMGSAAMAGTSAKVDRNTLAQSLGFEGIIRNAMDAVSSRDVAVEALSCATMTMLDASRLAEEQILWTSKEFGFAELDDAYSASSSIMPQKKNAVTSEIVRAKAGSVLGSLVAVCAILKALPYSYNLDLQEATPHLWRAFDDTTASVRVLAGSLKSMRFNKETIKATVAGDGSTAVALANALVKAEGISFRQAHAIVGELARVSVRKGVPLDSVIEGTLPRASAKFGKKLTMDDRTARKVLDPANFLASISTTGGSNPAFIGAELKLREKEFSTDRATLSGLGAPLRAAQRRLLKTASSLAVEVKPKN